MSFQTISRAFLVCPAFLGLFAGMLFFTGTASCQQPGDSLWARSLGGNSSALRGLALTTDGNMVVAGWTMSEESLYYWSAGLVVKTDAWGETLWSWMSTPTWVYGDSFSEVRIAPNGVCIVAGTSATNYDNSRTWLIAFDSDGDTLWSRKYTYGPRSEATALALTTEGDILLAGRGQQDSLNFEGLLIEVAPDGNVIQEHWLGDALDTVYEVQVLPDSAVLLTGYHGAQARLLKLDQDLAPLWTFNYGETGRTTRFSSVEVRESGGYLVVGNSAGEYPDQNILLACLDSMGDSVWTRRYDLGYYDGGYNLHSIPGGYLLSGKANNRFLTLRLDTLGAIVWQWNTVIGSNGQTLARPDGTCVSVGQLQEPGENSGLLIAHQNEPVTALAGDPESQPVTFELLPASPNPFNPVTWIPIKLDRPAQVKVGVYNLLGQEIAILKDEGLPAGETRVRFAGAGLAGGIYLVAAECLGQRKVDKVLLVK